MPVLSTGYEYTSLETRLARIRQRLTPTGLQFPPGSPDAALTYAIAQAIDDQALEVRDLAAIIGPSQAYGLWLVDQASIIGVSPSTGSYSTVVLTLQGDADLFIAAGDISVDGPDGFPFVSASDVTLDAEGAGVVTAQASIVGPLAAPAGTLDTTEGLPAGLDSVANENDAVPGTSASTDSELWTAMRDRIGVAAASTWDALYSAIYGPTSPGQCSDVRIFLNETDEDDGAGHPPNSIEVVVIGGDPDVVAQAIWTNTMGLTRVSNAQQVTIDVEDAAGGLHPVLFGYASEVAMSVNVTVRVGLGWPRVAAQGIAAVKAAIKAYFATLRIGGTVYEIETKCEVVAVAGVVDVPTLEFSDGSGFDPGNYEPTAWQICRVTDGRINVTVTR